jgi:hypothetical protein
VLSDIPLFTLPTQYFFDSALRAIVELSEFG